MGGETRNPRFLATAALLLVAAALHPAVAAFSELQTLRFSEGYSPLFGEGNLVRSANDRKVRLILDRYTGSGFISSDLYDHGFFSAKIKLPSNYTAGVVVAFYTSNGDIFRRNHDELDFEFLGNPAEAAGGCRRTSTAMAPPTAAARSATTFPSTPPASPPLLHLLVPRHHPFLRGRDADQGGAAERRHGGEFPAKPMALYATIWDGSSWATGGGRYKVDYNSSPFVADFSDLVLSGCKVDPIQMMPSSGSRCAAAEAELLAGDFAAVDPQGRRAMARFREKNLIYSFCYDSFRYSAAFPDCEIVPAEKERLDGTGHLKLAGRRRRRSPCRRSRDVM
ncbi:unnamed protein product [Spirodela intermedia]|uniref:Xyloglucan endotransglucosylase/hydrolase n=1 Tax=Spirodela intermedia TaxID=51605 RepID=A0A7I8J9Y4_SPIIN|nr:unnamed protein product [Spirodela intermedia]CAA6667036.1 unnamed protein product [Spirodela intermedia]